MNVDYFRPTDFLQFDLVLFNTKKPNDLPKRDFTFYPLIRLSRSVGL